MQGQLSQLLQVAREQASPLHTHQLIADKWWESSSYILDLGLTHPPVSALLCLYRQADLLSQVLPGCGLNMPGPWEVALGGVVLLEDHCVGGL